MLKKSYSKTQPLCTVTFSLPVEAAPDAEKVALLGDFNNWIAQEGAEMTRAEAHFEVTLELATGRSYEFRYLIDGKRWENDWDADAYLPSPFAGITNSVLVLEAMPLEQAPAKTAKKTAAPKPTKTSKSAKTTAADAPAADDLTKIEGIGPKIAEIFAAKGISTFAELAKAKPAALKAILEEAGNRFKMHDPGTWPKQAKLAAAGKWDELAKLQDELKGGK